jgi:hypothetical protein
MGVGSDRLFASTPSSSCRGLSVTSSLPSSLTCALSSSADDGFSFLLAGDDEKSRADAKVVRIGRYAGLGVGGKAGGLCVASNCAWHTLHVDREVTYARRDDCCKAVRQGNCCP